MSDAVAVVGMAARFPGARDLEEYWQVLREGRETITRFSAEELEAAGIDPSLLADENYVRANGMLADADLFDAEFFGFSPREAQILDPQQRIFLECAHEALERAGCDPDRFDGSIGVWAGAGGFNTYLVRNLLSNPAVFKTFGAYQVFTNNERDFLATRVSYKLDLKGQSVNVQTACSTSLVAIHMACQALLGFECDMALAGGVRVSLPQKTGYLYQEGMILSPDGHCRPFDRDAQGTLASEGCGVVVLKRLEDAVADRDHIHAVVLGSATNNDGAHKVGYTAPSVDGQARCIALAQAAAGVGPDDIGFLEAHGTATPVGDPIEVAALNKVFRKKTQRTNYCALGSVKSNFGHTDTAAGVASFIKAVLALEHGTIPPTLHFEAPNPEIDLEHSPFLVNTGPRDWAAPRHAGVSSFGLGGTNAHAVLGEAPAPPDGGPSRPRQLLLLSAHTGEALDKATENLAGALGDVDLADAAYTLQAGRKALPQRRMLVCTDTADAVAGLHDDERVLTQRAAEQRSVAFMFAGGGAQYPGMGAELYDGEPVYREAVDECIALLEQNEDMAIRGVLFGDDPAAKETILKPSWALPTLFTTAYALARLLMSWGIRPTAMIGHSMGEYVAACLAGTFSLKDALHIVTLRGRLFEELDEGGMLSVPLPLDELKAAMGPELSVAAVNTPDLTLASGPVAAIDKLEKDLAARGIETQRVHIAVAAHSAMVEPILDRFQRALEAIPFRAPEIPFVSNLSGTWITDEEATSPAYWVRHLRETVRFSDGVQKLLEDEGRVLLEVGPGRTLATLALRHPDKSPRQPVFSTLRHPKEEVTDYDKLLTVLGRLWLAGAAVDWAGFSAHEQRRKIPLPTYPFERKRYWIEPGESALADGDGALRKRRDLSSWFYAPSHAPAPPPARAATGDERWLVLADDCGLGGRLAERIGGTVVRAERGADFASLAADRYAIDPNEPSHYERLVEAVSPTHVLHCWNVTGGVAHPLAEAQERAFDSLLHLARALDEAHVTVLSDGLETQPAKALLRGPAKVIPLEIPGVSCQTIDVVLPPSGSWFEEKLLDHLVADALDASAGETIAYRGAERSVETFAPLPLGPADGPGVREGGVYLITGGLGGVGLAIAEHLARTARAKLVLVGRTAKPEAAAHLEALGAEVCVLAGDVADRGAMERVVRAARERFGRVHGVIHAAGVLDDGVIALKTPEAARRVLAPKVAGTLLLDELLADEPLDLFVLCSALSTATGSLGQIDYVAANAFMDAFARSRTAAGTYTVAIGWGTWRDVGLAAKTGARADHTFTMRAGADWRIDEHRVKGGDALLPGTGYLDLLAATVGKPVEFADVFFLAPFAVPDGEARDLCLRLTGDEFVFFSRVGGGSVEHARGRLQPPDGDAAEVDVAAVEQRCGDPFVPDNPHLELGPRWQSLREVRLGEGEALVRLELDGELRGDLDDHTLHAALLDHATGAAQRLLPGFDAARDFYVAFSYGSLRIRHPMTASMTSHIRLKESSADLGVFDMTLVDDAGRTLVEAADVTLKKSDGRAMAPVTAPDVGNPVLAVALAEGMETAEGVEAFARIVGHGAGSHVLVSPLDLDGLAELVARGAPAEKGADALDRPDLATPYVAPRTPLEERVAAVAGEVLGVGKLGVNDDFLELGGHSLLFVQIMTRLRKLSPTRLSVKDLFAKPTVAGIAKRMDGAGRKDDTKSIKRASRDAYRRKRADVDRP